MKKAIDFIRDEKAATSIEYALIATGIAVAIVAAVNGLGTTLNSKYTTVKTALD
jgi:pilus assembly protein Flp/PilA